MHQSIPTLTLADIAQILVYGVLTFAVQASQQAIPTDIIGILTGFGPLGLMVGWFMLRTEPRLDRIERAINTQTRAQMLDVLSRPGTTAEMKREAKKLLRDAGHPVEGIDGDDA